ncbi:AI-2E family transporter [Pseudoruegeria sp. HB172150]|uniref:AI-2E family transporter n=1 Tax=Pseudoruegeria sp. HB172150 TaxID=2721164 RepID=UPI0015579F1B|nr:AI-2E family transporter [Pseudoruegeria sp. HB172150]
MKNAPFLNLVLAVLLVIAVGWLLYVGQNILLPILTAVIAVYIIVTAADALGRLPVLRVLPIFVLRLLILAGFIIAILAFAVVIAATVRDIVEVAPAYQANLQNLVQQVSGRFDVDSQQLWDEFRDVTIGQISLQTVLLSVLGGFTSVGASVFLVIIYAAFLIGERGGFSQKIMAAMGDEERGRTTLAMITDMNRKIGDYLAIKTLINIILGVLSYAVLWSLDVDFALFWAVTIALFNYIPYVGSYIGVAMPVILSLAQFASIPMTLLLTALLTVMQVFVGNYLDPMLVGRQMNMSPFVVMVALSVWATLWGIPGAILAVPLTSVLAIILSSFDSTRFVAVLLAERIDEDPTGRKIHRI